MSLCEEIGTLLEVRPHDVSSSLMVSCHPSRRSPNISSNLSMLLSDFDTKTTWLRNEYFEKGNYMIGSLTVRRSMFCACLPSLKAYGVSRPESSA
jgi:hypothetical protein